MIQLQSGQNLALTQNRLIAILRWRPSKSELVLDASAYLLGANGKVGSDAEFLFYGQASAANGAVTLDAASATFTFDLGRLPNDIERVALALTIEQGARRGHRFDQVTNLTMTVTGDLEPIEFGLNTHAMQEAAVILGEFYKRNGGWKIRALGQGFHGGLGPLASHFGVEISDDTDQAMPQPPFTPPVNLKKITLDKRAPVSLEKGAGSFGEILVNLNWLRKPSASGGWNPFKKEKAVDLDVGCMFELHNGHKGVIQALGNSFGSFNDIPWIQLMGDDRTGSLTEGENLRINGTHWIDFKRILIFAFIYDGVPNWSSADAIVTLKSPGQPELTVKLDNHSDRQIMCAVALLENDDGRIRVTKLVDYYAGHYEMDQDHNFGFVWHEASK